MRCSGRRRRGLRAEGRRHRGDPRRPLAPCGDVELQPLGPSSGQRHGLTVGGTGTEASDWVRSFAATLPTDGTRPKGALGDNLVVRRVHLWNRHSHKSSRNWSSATAAVRREQDFGWTTAYAKVPNWGWRSAEMNESIGDERKAHHGTACTRRVTALHTSNSFGPTQPSAVENRSSCCAMSAQAAARASGFNGLRISITGEPALRTKST
jgi:hypothetical protein